MNKLDANTPKTVERDYKPGKTTWIPEIQEVVNVFYNYFKPRALSSDFIRNSMFIFCRNLKDGKVKEAMELSCQKMLSEEFDKNNADILNERAEQCVRYFCAVCWRQIQYSKAQTIVVKDGE